MAMHSCVGDLRLLGIGQCSGRSRIRRIYTTSRHGSGTMNKVLKLAFKPADWLLQWPVRQNKVVCRQGIRIDLCSWIPGASTVSCWSNGVFQLEHFPQGGLPITLVTPDSTRPSP